MSLDIYEKQLWSNIGLPGNFESNYDNETIGKKSLITLLFIILKNYHVYFDIQIIEDTIHPHSKHHIIMDGLILE